MLSLFRALENLSAKKLEWTWSNILYFSCATASLTI
jgi:hypothetical protein